MAEKATEPKTFGELYARKAEEAERGLLWAIWDTLYGTTEGVTTRCDDSVKPEPEE